MDTYAKILVTGAAGFMGSHIVDALVSAGYLNVFAVDDLSGGEITNLSNHLPLEERDIKYANRRRGGFYSKGEKVSFFELDLSDSKRTELLINLIKPDIIFHLAANAREGASFFQPLSITRRNYLAYINVLEPAIKHGLDKMVLFSSMSVYGNQSPPFYESMRPDPVDIYGINKAAMEHTTELLSKIHDFRYTILRPHNCFGIRQSLSDPYRNVIGIFMNRIMRKEPIYIYGDGEQQRAFSYIDNSLPCYIHSMDEKSDSQIINIGGIKPVTINWTAKQVCNAMGVDYDSYDIQHLHDRPNEVKVAFSSFAKSVSYLHYKEKIGLEEGITRMAVWAKELGPQKWKEEKLTLWNEKAPSIWK